MTRKREQHFVPKVYLKPFLDPDPPEGWPDDRPFEPSVWVLNPSLSGSPERRAPHNILWRAELYNLPEDDSENPRVEDALGRLENAFAPIQRAILSREGLSLREYGVLCLFVGAQSGRTPRQMGHWQGVIDKVRHLSQQMAPDGAADDFWAGADEAGVRSVALHSQAYADVVSSTGFLLVNESSIPFITSDNPVSHSFLHVDDPPVRPFPPEMRAPVGPNVRTFFSYLPLSPDTAFVSSPLLDNGSRLYCRTTDERLAFALNQLTRYHAVECLIANSPRPYQSLTQWVILAEAIKKATAGPRNGLLIYTDHDRHWIEAESVAHDTGAHPLHNRIRFIAADPERLRAAVGDPQVRSVEYKIGGRSGRMRDAWFASVALEPHVESVIESFPGGWSAWGASGGSATGSRSSVVPGSD